MLSPEMSLNAKMTASERGKAAGMLRHLRSEGARNLAFAVKVIDVRAYFANPADALGAALYLSRALSDPKEAARIRAEGEAEWAKLTRPAGSSEAAGELLVRIGRSAVSAVGADLVRHGLRRSRTTSACVEYRGTADVDLVKSLVAPWSGEVLELRPLQPGPDQDGADSGDEARSGLRTSTVEGHDGSLPPEALAVAAQSQAPESLPEDDGSLSRIPNPPAECDQFADAAAATDRDGGVESELGYHVPKAGPEGDNDEMPRRMQVHGAPCVPPIPRPLSVVPEKVGAGWGAGGPRSRPLSDGSGS